MKHRRKSHRLIIGVAVAGALALSIAAGVEEAPEPNASTPAEVLQALHEALASGDETQVKSLLDAGVLIFEEGNVERSLDEYAAHHLPADLKFMSSVSYEQQRESGHTEGDLAWIATEGRMTNKGPEPAERIGTETVVLQRKAGQWKIVHIHWSSREARKRA
jgi:ketosteroid isomerase-like protein